jgi:2C-methyl-D-erythritol 2,4-cyclodiphosphate synthase
VAAIWDSIPSTVIRQINFKIYRTAKRIRYKVATRLSTLHFTVPKTIHGFVQRNSPNEVEVTIYLEEPVLYEHVTSIFKVAKEFQVQSNHISMSSTSSDSLAIVSLSCKFKIVRNKPEHQDGYSRYEEEDFAVNDAFSMVTSIHDL